MNRLILFITALTIAAALQAQKLLKEPLTYVPADSVVIWGEDISDLRGTALKLDASLTEQPLGEPGNKKDFVRKIKKWQTEYLPQINLAGGLGEENLPQTVATANMTGLTADLLRLTADSRLADVMERSLFNQLLREVALPGEMTMEKHVAAQALINATGKILATDEEGIYINLYLNSTAHVRTKQFDVMLDILTAMPHEGRIKVRLSGFRGNALPLKLRLRLPEWAMGKITPADRFAIFPGAADKLPVFHVNGRELLTTVIENGYLVIDRKWNSGDEVFFDLPMQPFLVRKMADGKAQRGKVAIQRGPLLYVVREEHDDCYLSANTLPKPGEDFNRWGHILLTGQLFRDRGTPADAAAPAVTITAEPYMDNKGDIWLREMR